MDPTFYITNQGLDLIVKLIDTGELTLTKVTVGSGKVLLGQDPKTFTDLIQYVADATSTMPVVNNRQLDMIVEYRNDLNGGLLTGFWNNEFGIFALDPDIGEILFCYATLGDYPQWIGPYEGTVATDVVRYPVSIGLSSDATVVLNYQALAFVTHEELEAHNQDPNSHPDLQQAVYNLQLKINNLSGFEISMVVDTYADLMATPVPADGIIYLVRNDENQGNQTTIYEAIGGVWVFLAVFGINLDNYPTIEQMNIAIQQAISSIDLTYLDVPVSTRAPADRALDNNIWTDELPDIIRNSSNSIADIFAAIEGSRVWESYTPGTYTVSTLFSNSMFLDACGGGGRGADGNGTGPQGPAFGGGGADAILKRRYDISVFGSLTITIGAGATVAGTSGQPTTIVGNILNTSGQIVSSVGIVTLLGGGSATATQGGSAGGTGGGVGSQSGGGGSIGGGGASSTSNSRPRAGNGILGNGAGSQTAGGNDATPGTTNGAGSMANGPHGGEGRKGGGGGGGLNLQGTTSNGGRGGNGYVYIRY